MLRRKSSQSMIQIQDPQFMNFQPGIQSIQQKDQQFYPDRSLQDKLIRNNEIGNNQNSSIYNEQEVNLHKNIEIQSVSQEQINIFQVEIKQPLINNKAQSSIIPNKAQNRINSTLLQSKFNKKRKKNSNTIKKMGRIILDNLYQYYDSTIVCQNEGVVLMQKALSKKSKVGRIQINKRDKFNTHHLRLLVDTASSQLSDHNLKVTRKILNKHLRENVLLSKQISDHNKELYLNTMKCSSLRCINKKLAVRLQMSD